MSESSNLPAERHSLKEVAITAHGAGAALMPESMADVVRFAEIMCKADLALPAHCRGNPGICMSITLQALRWEMDPFMVANKTYAVNGRMAYEAQLVAAVIHTRAPIVGRPIYSYSGEGPTRRCKVEITMKSGQVLEYESPMFKDISVKNSPLWKADLDQQLGYFTIRSWGRRHTPEVLLGVYVPEEVEQFQNVTPVGSGLRAKLDAARDAEPQEGGFSVKHLDAELGGDIDESHFAPPTEEDAGDEPETADAEEQTNEGDPLLIDIGAATDDQHKAWSQALMARIMREQTSTGAMAVWREHFDDRIKPLYGLNSAVYDSLDAWMQARMKKLRDREKASG